MPNEESPAVLGMPDMGGAEQAMPTEGAPTEGAPMEGAPNEGKVTVPKKEAKDKEAENDLLKRMMYSPSASDADSTITLDKTTDEEDKKDIDTKTLLKTLEGKGKESDKYQKELFDKALKDPNSVQVKTEQGWMSVGEAIGLGFDFRDGKFHPEKAIPHKGLEEVMNEQEGLSDRDKETLRRLTAPGAQQANRRPMNAEQGEQPQAGGEQPVEGGGQSPQEASMAEEGPRPENVKPSNAGMNEIGEPVLEGLNSGGTNLPLGGV